VEPLALRAEDAQEFDGPGVGVAEPVREVGVEFGDLAGGEDEILLTEHHAKPSVEDVQPVVSLVRTGVGPARRRTRRSCPHCAAAFAVSAKFFADPSKGAGARPGAGAAAPWNGDRFSDVDDTSDGASDDALDVDAFTTAIESFNRFYIRIPMLEKLPFTTLSVLDTLAVGGPMRMTELTRTEQVSQPGITQLVSRLERDGLVERRPDPDDGRAVLVHITEAGGRIVRSRREDRMRHLAPLVERLTGEQRRALADALPVLTRLAELGRDEAGSGEARRREAGRREAGRGVSDRGVSGR
jgi:DNA-binding MarR family transcriptional regulator